MIFIYGYGLSAPSGVDVAVTESGMPFEVCGAAGDAGAGPAPAAGASPLAGPGGR